MGSIAKSCVKYLLFTFNLLCALLGIAILSIGAMNLKAHFDNVKLSHVLQNLPIGLIVLGSIIFIIAFFGCCGALLESRCMLLTFAALIIFVFIAELLGGIALYSLYNESSLREDFTESLKYYNVDKDVTKFWDFIQDDFHCCGVTSVEDYGGQIPNSCCKDLDVNDVCHEEHAYETGCMDMIKFLKQIAPIFLSVLAALQLLSIGFALYLGRRKNQEIV